jgi:hypothetical protein
VRGRLQIRERLLLARDRDVLRLEPLVDVDAELLLGEVAKVADGGLHPIAAPEVLADGLGLGRRLDDDERRRAGRCRQAVVLDRNLRGDLSTP